MEIARYRRDSGLLGSHKLSHHLCPAQLLASASSAMASPKLAAEMDPSLEQSMYSTQRTRTTHARDALGKPERLSSCFSNTRIFRIGQYPLVVAAVALFVVEIFVSISTGAENLSYSTAGNLATAIAVVMIWMVVNFVALKGCNALVALMASLFVPVHVVS